MSATPGLKLTVSRLGVKVPVGERFIGIRRARSHGRKLRATHNEMHEKTIEKDR